jgi:hypothetical protein
VLIKPHAILLQGNSGSYKWRALTHRNSPAPGAKYRPCLDVSIGHRPSSLRASEIFVVCGSVTPFPDVLEAAVGTDKRRLTVIAMAYSQRVRMVLVDLGARGKRRIRLRLLSTSKARKVHVKKFRFAALALAGPLCIHRLVGFDAKGHMVIDDKQASC